MAKKADAKFLNMWEEAYIKLTPEEKYHLDDDDDDDDDDVDEDDDDTQGESKKLKYEAEEGSESSSEDEVDDYDVGVPKDLRPHLRLMRQRYSAQLSQSMGFDILDFPGKTLGVSLLRPEHFSDDLDKMTELANLAINEYNAKHVFKYKLLKIEKANYMLTGYHRFYMTVKVSNLTLGTPIDTFQILGIADFWGKDKKIKSCWSKEEAPVVAEQACHSRQCT